MRFMGKYNMKENLKNYEDKLVYFVIFNLSWFIILNYDLKLLIDNYGLITIILSTSIFYFPIYMINNYIKPDWKFILLYPFKDKHRYASDIFTKIKTGKIKVKKELIDIELISKKYGYTKDSTFEDNLWYKLYLKYKYNPKIYQQHREFLFCRDMTAIMLLLSVFLIALNYFMTISIKNRILIVILILIIEFIIVRKLAIKQNEKFALSVLQEETNNLKRKPEKNRISKKSKNCFMK